MEMQYRFQFRAAARGPEPGFRLRKPEEWQKWHRDRWNPARRKRPETTCGGQRLRRGEGNLTGSESRITRIEIGRSKG